MSDGVLSSDQTTSNKDGTTPLFIEVGERKYDPDAAIKKIENADNHIKTIEDENAELRLKLDKATVYEDLLEAMKTSEKSADQTGQEITKESIAELVEQQVVNLSKETVKENNLLEADKLMRDKFGDKAKDMLESKAKEIGIGVSTFTSIAAQSPKALMAWFKDTGPTPTSNEPASHNIDVLDASIKEGTYAFYQEMRKKNLNLYNSAAIQRKMVDDANRLGQEAFFST